MTTPRTDLSAFAAGLADRLPGTWTSQYQRHAQYTDRFPRTEQLWDSGHVDYIVSQYVLTHDAVLHGPADQRLYVADRPRYPHHFDAVEEPHGIAVPKDPVRAAARVARRVLPRYEQALQAVLNNAAGQPDYVHHGVPMLSDGDARSQLHGLAERIHHVANDMPLTGAAHPVSDNLDELSDRVSDIAMLLTHIATAAAVAEREATSHPGRQTNATRRRVTALTHTAGVLGHALADLGEAVAHAGILHHAAQRSTALRSALEDHLNGARGHLNEAGRGLHLDADRLTPARPRPLPRSAAPDTPPTEIAAATSTRKR